MRNERTINQQEKKRPKKEVPHPKLIPFLASLLASKPLFSRAYNSQTLFSQFGRLILEVRQDLEGRNLGDIITCRRTLMKLPSYERATLILTKIPYLPNRKYFMANSIMEYFPEFSSDFSDFTLSVRLRVSNCMFGSRFNRLPAEAAFFRPPLGLGTCGS